MGIRLKQGNKNIGYTNSFWCHQNCTIFQKVINDAEHTEELLKDILDHWLIDHSGNNIFDGVFQYLRKHTDKQSLYSNLLQTIFHTKVTWATLYIDFLKWAEWELWMRIWDNPYFGVINVWDDTKLFKLAQDNGIDGIERDFSDSLFDWINEKNSLINLLIGSKKFTEWRSSRRVSTMGLMNIGRSEWSQIIQLFGRGVRLKWYDMSLKDRVSWIETKNLNEKHRSIFKS